MVFGLRRTERRQDVAEEEYTEERKVWKNWEAELLVAQRKQKRLL